MKKNTFVISVITFAVLSATSALVLTQAANASPRNLMIMADASMNGMNMNNMKMEAAQVTHRGTGIVKKIDTTKGLVTLSHGPIASLNWPAMTMSFKLKDVALAQDIKVGDVVDFELVQSGGDYVVTRLSGK
jgi:Cu/Ag efflux protein CusF